MPRFQASQDGASTWAETRRQGRRAFVVRHGLTWAALTCFLLAGWGGLSGRADVLDGRWLAIQAVLWPVAGLAYGSILWALNERAFRARAGGEVGTAPGASPRDPHRLPDASTSGRPVRRSG